MGRRDVQGGRRRVGEVGRKRMPILLLRAVEGDGLAVLHIVTTMNEMRRGRRYISYNPDADLSNDSSTFTSHQHTR